MRHGGHTDQFLTSVLGSFPAIAENTLHGDRDGFRMWSLFICTLRQRRKRRRKRRLHPLICERLQNEKFHILYVQRKRYCGKFIEFYRMPISSLVRISLSIEFSVLNQNSPRDPQERRRFLLDSPREKRSWNGVRCVRLRATLRTQHGYKRVRLATQVDLRGLHSPPHIYGHPLETRTSRVAAAFL
jgi:hypothetical protein